jgi:hypothetical protein
VNDLQESRRPSVRQPLVRWATVANSYISGVLRYGVSKRQARFLIFFTKLQHRLVTVPG